MTPGPLRDPGLRHPPTLETPLLSVRGVRKAFGDHVVLDDLSLDVYAHKVVVLIGASGSGKSTLLRCIDLLEDVDDGVIELEGQDITDPDAPIWTTTRWASTSSDRSSSTTCGPKDLR